MKKVINVTLGGLVFAIEQDVYDKLSAYLESIKQHLSGTDDYDEIIADVESAIAEKFVAMKRNEKSAVTEENVAAVIKEMGSPADFGEGNGEEGDESDQGESQTEPSVEEKGSETKKRLYRDTDDVILAGVASGLARYFNIDPVIVRLLFVIAVFFNGFGILAYVILWLIVPKAETTAQKYAMRGEMVTIKEITERVKKNIGEIDQKNVTEINGIWQPVRAVLAKVFALLGGLLRGILKLARYVIAVVMVLVGALGTAALLSFYILVLASEKALLPEEVQLVINSLTDGDIGFVATLSSFLVIAIPLQVLIIAGASLLARRNFFTVSKSTSLAVVWLIAIVLAATTIALQVEQVVQKIQSLEKHEEHETHLNADEPTDINDQINEPPIEEGVPSLPPAGNDIQVI